MSSTTPLAMSLTNIATINILNSTNTSSGSTQIFQLPAIINANYLFSIENNNPLTTATVSVTLSSLGVVLYSENLTIAPNTQAVFFNILPDMSNTVLSATTGSSNVVANVYTSNVPLSSANVFYMISNISSIFNLTASSESQEIIDINTNIQNLNNDINDIYTSIFNVSAEIASSNVGLAINTISSNLNTTNTIVDSNTNNINIIINDIDTINKEINILTDSVNSIDVELNNIQNEQNIHLADIDNNATNITALSSSLNSTNTNIANISNNLNTTNSNITVLQAIQALPLGQVNLTYSLSQQTIGGYFSTGSQTYEVPTYTNTYAANSDTYEFINSQGDIISIAVATGAAQPATPTGYVPFQKVSTTSLETPTAPSISVTTGGTLAAGTYNYQTVMINASGNSLPSVETSATVSANGVVDIAWRVVPYATEVQLYRNGFLIYQASVGTSSGQNYTDTGATTLDVLIPTVSTSNFVYKSTPLYNLVNTLEGKTIRLSRFAPYQYQDITALLLGVMEYGQSIYQGASYNDGINGVKIIIPDGFFSIGQPITVPEGLTVDCDGYLLNKCGDMFSPCLTFGVGTFSNELQIEGNGNSGIVLGMPSAQISTHFGNIRVQGCGTTYNPVLGLGQTALLMSGYNIEVETLQIYEGNVGLFMLGASDIRIGKAIIIRSSTGLEMSGCQQVGINYIDIDTPVYQAATIDASQDIFIRGVMWINGVNYTGVANTNTFLQIGKYSNSTDPNSALNLQLNLLNCGVEPIYLAEVTESILNVIVGKGGQTEYPPQSVITYGPNVDQSVLLTGTASIPTASSWNNGSAVAGTVSLYVNGTLAPTS